MINLGLLRSNNLNYFYLTEGNRQDGLRINGCDKVILAFISATTDIKTAAENIYRTVIK